MEQERNFLDVFNELLSEQGLTRKAFAQKSGIPYTTVIGWTNLGRLPDFVALKKIADFFGCSTDYLAGRQDDYGYPVTNAALTQKEEKLLYFFRNLKDEDKELLIKLATSLNK